MSAVSAYLPSIGDLAGLAAVLAVGAAFVALGALVRGSGGLPEADFLCGWALVALLFTLAGTLSRISFVTLAWLTLAVTLAALLTRRGRRADWGGFLRTALLGLPLLVLLAGAPATQWDDLSNWLPNQRFLVAFDAFPRPDLPPTGSVFPTYPYGMAFPVYLAGRLAGRFVENAGMLFNLLALLALGRLLARLISLGNGEKATEPLSWGQLALGCLVASVLNPTFVPKIVFTTHLDFTTAAAAAFAIALLWRSLEAALARDDIVARDLALQAGLTLALLVSLKQSNAVLVALIAGGGGLIVLRMREIEWSRTVRPLLWLVVPTAVIYLAWRIYADQVMPGGEFGFKPLDVWELEVAKNAFLRMLLIATKKGGYFAAMLVVCIGAAIAWWRKPGPTGRLAILVAVLFLGFNFFLWVAYVGAFGRNGEGESAASFWRYNTQLGGALLVIAVVALRDMAAKHITERALRPLAIAAVALCLVGPFIVAKRVRFDFYPVTRYLRATGAELKAVVRADSVVGVIDPRGDGWADVVVRYELYPRATTTDLSAGLKDGSTGLPPKATTLPYLWVHQTTPTVDRALGLTLDPHASSLLEHAGSGWRVLRSWPYPGYDDPIAVPK
ncbi:MAG TPA: hypothetical protein VGB82_26815 [Alphaproteobacteria bacterium]